MHHLTDLGSRSKFSPDSPGRGAIDITGFTRYFIQCAPDVDYHVLQCVDMDYTDYKKWYQNWFDGYLYLVPCRLTID